jgi:DHA1 family solute carrier family 18 vesicular amine transporter 1/2
VGLIFVTPFISFFSDRFNNRKVPMLMGLVGLITSTLAFAYTDSFIGLAVARFGQGVSAGISWTIGLAMISDVYLPSELGSVMGWVLTANSFGFLIGPPLGGVMSQFISQEAPYLLCTGLALIDLIGRLYIKPAIPSLEGEDERLLNSRSNSPTSLSPQRNDSIYSFIDLQVIITCLAIIISAGIFSGIEPTLPIYLAQVYNFNVSKIGALWLAIIFPNMISGIVSGSLSDKYGRKNITAFGLFLFGISSILVGFSYNIYTVIISLLLFGFTGGVAMTPSLPEFGDFAQERGGKSFAQAYAMYNVAYSIGMIFGPIIGGYLYESVGFKYQMLGFGIISIFTSPIVFYFWLIRKPKQSEE